ncbi:bifunctional RNase H/acid phosphatase [Mycobacterium sherrisii]|uniref:Bifunctional RNase H/acid phosphatase n=1 Tax=Mycobacterium sherrisii TaxID=243061 RepID=A0A1E3SV16_9MYCO|nr:bifunctional RNase H/acid phosphatase [Mycobacterium sherrisii]MCV7032465.1 bifunctional RNase H/acid phosphatase [Mycobacterium sherrisii]ODR05368.1 bifunctional RNase H/acid phosphatase [Mycobacterium sherrisii]ORW73294.1 acid phosphatase [Mycobacterium sherrisii]
MKVIVEADGGSRGNPGPAGYGAVVHSADRATVLAESMQAIGRATNNVAEYRGLIAGLEDAARLDASEVDVFMDSKLVVEQMSGRWKVKHPDLAELHAQARRLAARFDRITYTWIPRERNKHADRLANEAMDAAAEVDTETPEPESESKDVVPQAASSPGWTGARGHPTRLLLLRHGQTGLSVQRRYSGRGNPELTEVGRQQAQAAARYLAARGGIAAVISSPLQRAYDTATAAAKALGLDVIVDDDLIETDFGAWEGLTFLEAAERDPELHTRWLRDTSTEPPGGESFDAALERVLRARDRIIADYPGATVLVVSHVTPIKMVLRMALDAGPGILYRLHLDLASLSIAEFYSDGASSVRLVNQTGYL